MSKKEINGKDVDGNEVNVFVVSPKSADKAEAEIVERKTFAKLINERDEDGNPTAILQSRIEEYARNQGLWTDNKQKEKNALAQKIIASLEKLESGNIKLKEAKEVALTISDLRSEMTMLEAPLTELRRFSVESQCTDASFNHLLVKCIKNEDGKQIFKDVKEYKEAPNHPWLREAFNHFMQTYYGLDEDWEKQLPENKFLLDYGFVDKDLKFIDAEGNHINRSGEKVQEREEVKFSPFLDDEGNPVEPSTTQN